MLKTYSARTMAEALAQVKNDLGPDAVIVHTRSFRVGGVLGMGAKPVVEITASDDASLVKPPTKRAPTRAIARPQTAPASEHAPPASQIEPKPEAPARAPDNATPAFLGGYIPPGAAAPVSRLIAPPSPNHAPTPAPGPNASHRPAPAIRSAPASPPASTPPSPEPRPAPSPMPAPQAQPSSAPPAPASQPPLRTSSPVSPHPAPQPESPAPAPDPEPRRPSPPVAAPSVLEPPAFSAPPPSPTPPANPSPPAPSRASEPGSPPLPARVTPPPGGSVEQELGELRRLVGQVLQSTRRTEVRTGSVLRFDAPMPEPLLALYMRLIDADVRPELAEQIAADVRNELSVAELEDEQIVRQTMLRQIETRIPVIASPPPLRSEKGRATVIALVGPTGVGKTTSVAKLAATYKLRHGRSVGLITADTYRIAAVEQLRTYAGIIGLPLHVVKTPQETRAAIESLRDMDVVVLDTAGRSQNDAKRLDELQAHLRAAEPDQTHLVLSTTVGARVLKRTVERFSQLSPDRLILTKLDEAESLGLALDATEQTGVPISFVTTGQEVPDDIEPGDALRLARRILDGPADASEGVGAVEGSPG